VPSRGGSWFPFKTNILNVFRISTQVNTFLRPLAADKLFFQSISFFKVSRKAFQILKKCIEPNLLIFKFTIIYLPGTVWYCGPFLRYRRPKRHKKHPPPLVLEKYYPDFAVQGRLSIPVKTNILNVFWPNQDVFATLSPWKLFSKNSFFSKYLKKAVRDIEKNVQKSNV